MGRQEEFHSFHNLVVSNLLGKNTCCLYLVICNPMNELQNGIANKGLQTIEKIIEEL